MQEHLSYDRTRANCPVEQLAWYANHTLAAGERATVEQHVTHCAACQRDVAELSAMRASMQSVSVHTPEPRADLFALVEARLDNRTARAIFRRLLQSTGTHLDILVQHCAMQARLIRRDLLWMPLLIVPLAALITILPYFWLDQANVIAFSAALITAVGMAFLYSQESDPAREVTLIAPTSPRLLLAIRCGIVFAYGLLINLLSMLPLLLAHAAITPAWFFANWLAPLCCLAAISLCVSILTNPTVAIFVCALLWVLRAMSSLPLLQVSSLQQYEAFWHQGPLLYAIAALAILLTFLCFERKERFSI